MRSKMTASKTKKAIAPLRCRSATGRQRGRIRQCGCFVGHECANACCSGGVASSLPADRRAHDGGFGERACGERLDDASAIDHHDLIAEIHQFRNFRGVEQHRAAGIGVAADQVIDFRLGADIDSARRIVQQQDPAIRQEPFGDSNFLLISAAEISHRRPQRPPDHLDHVEHARTPSFVRNARESRPPRRKR